MSERVSVRDEVRSPIVLTVGHSDHALSRFLDLLGGSEVTAVADVRSAPFSRRVPHFSRPVLKAALRSARITYVFLGHQLGARPLDANCYVEGRADYDRIAVTRPFQEGLRRIEYGARRHTIALMCAEREPLDCHRTVLVAQHLRARGIEIQHILADGTVEPHSLTEARLIERMFGKRPPDLFSTDASPLSKLREAYSKRGREIAYRAPPIRSETKERLIA